MPVGRPSMVFLMRTKKDDEAGTGRARGTAGVGGREVAVDAPTQGPEGFSWSVVGSY